MQYTKKINQAMALLYTLTAINAVYAMNNDENANPNTFTTPHKYVTPRKALAPQSQQSSHKKKSNKTPCADFSALKLNPLINKHSGTLANIISTLQDTLDVHDNPDTPILSTTQKIDFTRKDNKTGNN